MAKTNAFEEINSKYGKNTIRTIGEDSFINTPVIPTGSFSLDLALGVGGIPVGRIIEAFGPEACIDSKTFVQYSLYDKKTSKRINSKGGTIERLYERFHDTDVSGIKQGRHLQNKEVDFYINSVNDEDRVISNRILDVVQCGEKDIFEVVTEEGHKISCTEDHKFKTKNGFVPLKELSIGSSVFIHNNTHFKLDNTSYPNRKEKFVKYHPNGIKKIIEGKYVYYRVKLSHFCYEAHINGYDLDTWKDILNKESIDYINTHKFIPQGMHIHHEDENPENNSFSNLTVIDPKKHGYIHVKSRHNNLRFIVVEDVISSIKYNGKAMTYDLKCAYPYNNYIANRFVVHNSGKTTLCLGIIAQAQKLGKTAAFIDVEHALDPTWATTCGVDIGSVYISQPDNGEMAIDIIKMLIGEVDLVILDSVAGLVPKAELEGEVEDSHMALTARLMSKAMRILAGAAKESNTTIIFTNQLRQKIGVTWGNPEVTTGGKALQYWASVRLDIRRTGKIEEKGEVVGSTTKVTVRKNKVGPPLRVVDFNIYADEGISKLSEIINFGISNGTINKKGAGWFTILPETEAIKVQGMGSVKEYMLNNPAIYQKLENELRKANNLPLVIDA